MIDLSMQAGLCYPVGSKEELLRWERNNICASSQFETVYHAALTGFI